MNMKTKKNYVVIAVIAVLVIAVLIILISGSSRSKSCEACDELIEIQKEIGECRDILNSPEYNGDNEGSLETVDTENKLNLLLGQYETLSKHECDASITNVKNQEYIWVREATLGTYTGEWKSFGPCGTGTYSGSNPYQSLYWDSGDGVLEYSGEWEYGVPNGYGKYCYYQESMGRASVNYSIAYEGEFVDGKFNGQGTLTEPYGLNSYFNVNMQMSITGTFSGGKLTDSAEYVVYDSNGELYDRGYVDKNRSIIQSVRADKQKEEVDRQTKETLGELGKSIWDMLF